MFLINAHFLEAFIDNTVVQMAKGILTGRKIVKYELNDYLKENVFKF